MGEGAQFLHILLRHPSLEEVRAAMLVLQGCSSSPAGAAEEHCERLSFLGRPRLAPPYNSVDRLRCKGMRWELGEETELGHRLL